ERSRHVSRRTLIQPGVNQNLLSKKEMQMSDISFNWHLESSSDDQSTSASGRIKNARGDIFDDAGNHVAHYHATLSSIWDEKRVILWIGYLEKDRNYKKWKKNDVLLELWRQEGEVMTRDASDQDFECVLLN